MSVEKLERVLWRVRQRNPGKKVRIPWGELHRAVMYECGTDPATYTNNRKALVRLGWIVTRKGRFDLTDEDLKGA